MNIAKAINMTLFAFMEIAPYEEIFTKLKNWILPKFLTLLFYFKVVVTFLRIYLFPIRANKIIDERHSRRITYQEIVGNDVQERVLILPPSTTVYAWVRVEAFIAKETEVDDFSDTDDEDVACLKIDRDAEEEKIDVTDEILKFAGPNKDFFGVNLTPTMINQEWNSLRFTSKNMVKIFYKNDPIILDEFA